MSYPITVIGTDIEFGCEPGQTVLEAAETAGWSIPYSCRKGVCTSCVGDLQQGMLAVRGNGEVSGPTEKVLLCRAEPHGPVRIEPRRIEQRDPPARKTLTAVVHRIRQPAERVTIVDLRFPIGRRIPFRAGQFLNVFLSNDDARSYSLANPPQHNDAAELHVRTEPGGRFSHQTVSQLCIGDLMTLEAPFGESSLEDGSEPLVLLATGTGFAPVKSIVQDHINRRRTRPIHLYWGARGENDLYLLDLVLRWTNRYDWFRVTPVLSRPHPSWTGATGWIQHAALTHYPDLRGHTVYACGNEPMPTDAFATLTRHANLAEHNFHADTFVPAGDAADPSNQFARDHH